MYTLDSSMALPSGAGVRTALRRSIWLESGRWRRASGASGCPSFGKAALPPSFEQHENFHRRNMNAARMPRTTVRMPSNTICFTTVAPGIGCTT